jgi:branched-chain amino acid transport system ATP-binding protein
MPEPILRLQRVSAGYGATVIVEDIDLHLARGEALSLIGRNGVGKTTLLTTIAGHTTLHSGTIRLGDTDISSDKPYRRVWRGLGWVPQEREIFPSLTVQEHLKVAARRGHWTPQRVFALFPQLDARQHHLGNQLSGGEQQMLAIGRALVGNPLVLLLDEPSEGLAPVLVEELQLTLTRLRAAEAMAMVLVEQNSRVALAFAERCVVMNRGRMIHDGPSAALSANRTLLQQLIGLDTR